MPLSITPCVFAEEYEKLVKFTEDINGFKDKKDQKGNKEVDVKKDPKKK